MSTTQFSFSKVRVERIIEIESCLTTKVHIKTVFEPYPDPLVVQKVKNYPKIKSNSKVRIDGIIENESCLAT